MNIPDNHGTAIKDNGLCLLFEMSLHDGPGSAAWKDEFSCVAPPNGKCAKQLLIGTSDGGKHGTSASTFARRGTRGGSVPNLHIRSGSPAPRLSFTSSICLAASGAGSETLKHSVHAGRTQPERVELRRSGVAGGIPGHARRGASGALKPRLPRAIGELYRVELLDSKRAVACCERRV